MSLSTVQRYYDAFNSGDWAAMLALLDENIEHDINQGGREVGREAFAQFLARMDVCYSEQLTDIVLMANADETRIAAEFIVNGVYKQTDPGFVEATGQTYALPAGAFLEMRDGRIARVTMYYNVADWLRQVGASA